MKITIESTSKIVELAIEGVELGSIPARIWEGTTDSGIPVVAFITRISPQTHDDEEFQRELLETRAPSPVVVSYPMRLIL